VIRFSRRTDYGFMAIRHLAMQPAGSYCCAREIARQHGIPQALTAKLLQRLARRGLVASQHGTKGGYQIARPASQITLREVVEAIEGPCGLTDCLTDTRAGCGHVGNCTVQEPLSIVNRQIAAVLESATLATLTGRTPATPAIETLERRPTRAVGGRRR
jgi:Rrf2 family protein